MNSANSVNSRHPLFYPAMAATAARQLLQQTRRRQLQQQTHASVQHRTSTHAGIRVQHRASTCAGTRVHRLIIHTMLRFSRTSTHAGIRHFHRQISQSQLVGHISMMKLVHICVVQTGNCVAQVQLASMMIKSGTPDLLRAFR